MNPQVLIDAIVRQTTVFLARLSTVDGVRSPLGHIANDVFVGLVSELESQGVSNKVIADMFGLALRSYRQKVQRLGESATTRGVTLWSAVQTFLAERGSATRGEVLEQFRHDEEASVRGILKDLEDSGFVVRSGRAEETRYRLATAEELLDFGSARAGNTHEAQTSLVWVQIYREGPLDRKRLSQLIPLSTAAIDAAIESLLSDGRVHSEARGSEEVFTTQEVLIPVGATAGWEGAVVDHHRAVLSAIAAKLEVRSSTPSDEVGGTTLTFDLWPGHPREAEVRSLLRSTRARVLPLWDEVSEYNRAHPEAESYQVHYYCGQYAVREDETS
jgi:hypothetical protein